MTNCNHLSDRMPAVAHGNAAWSIEDARHLAACEDCRQEWALVRRTAELGAKTVPPINSAAVADAVLRRLRAPEPTAVTPIRRRGGWIVAALAVAASLVFLIWNENARSGPLPREIARDSGLHAPVETGQLELSVPELEDLEADELETIIGDLDRPFRADELLESPSWGEVESRAIERGLSTSVEG